MGKEHAIDREGGLLHLYHQAFGESCHLLLVIAIWLFEDILLDRILIVLAYVYKDMLHTSDRYICRV